MLDQIVQSRQACTCIGAGITRQNLIGAQTHKARLSLTHWVFPWELCYLEKLCFFFSPINENYLCTTSVMLWIFRECWSPIFIIDYNSKYGTISIYKRQKQSFRFTSCPREVALSQSESQEAICNNFLPSCLDVWIEETGSRFTSSDVWPQMSHKMDL